MTNILTILFVVAAYTISDASEIIVNTASGSIKGTQSYSRTGRIYNAFFAVPYAEPPIKSLRLKNPVPIKAWEGVKSCKKPVPHCIQVLAVKPITRNLLVGKEDCLYMNIFTPKINTDKSLAVLVNIHGGGFMEGMPPPPNGADYFMDEDVVLVTIQYRLGILGFLSLEDEILPGNFGLKDQALALAWIKSNIANFGGDPNRITIFGESAGGASVNYHMKSPLSKHLINGAISESGVVNPLWTFQRNNTAKRNAMLIADVMGCGGSSSLIILQCLQKADTNKLVKLRNNFIVWEFLPGIPFKPVVEKKGSEGAFITEDPMKITTNIPWITGFTTNEGAFLTGTLTAQNVSVTNDFVANINSYLPHVLFINSNNDVSNKTIKLVIEKYFSQLDNDSVLKGLDKVVLEAWFRGPMLNAVEKHNGPKYVYQFNYRGGNSLVDDYGVQPKDLGVSHTDEILLLFNMTGHYPKIKKTDEQVSKNLVKMWAKFAQEGKPSPDWKEWKNGEYLLIEETNSMKIAPGLWKESQKFWSDLPSYKTSQT